MSNTTRENVICIAPELGEVEKGLFGLIIEDVQKEVGACFGDKQEQAQRYLAAHYLTLLNPDDKNVTSPGGIKKVKVGDHEEEYNGLQNIKDSTRYDVTSYGSIYESIKRKTSAGMGAIFVTP